MSCVAVGRVSGVAERRHRPLPSRRSVAISAAPATSVGTWRTSPTLSPHDSRSAILKLPQPVSTPQPQRVGSPLSRPQTKQPNAGVKSDKSPQHLRALSLARWTTSYVRLGAVGLVVSTHCDWSHVYNHDATAGSHKALEGFQDCIVLDDDIEDLSQIMAKMTSNTKVLACLLLSA